MNSLEQGLGKYPAEVWKEPGDYGVSVSYLRQTLHVLTYLLVPFPVVWSIVPSPAARSSCPRVLGREAWSGGLSIGHM